LGYAPSQNQAFFSHFQEHGFSVNDLVEAGLAKQGQNEIYPFFRDRLTIPIRDQLGNVIAFGARALHADQEPKYLNSSESIIYDKSGTLYGIDHLKQGVKEHKAIIIVE
jgi:DNA primase